MEWRKSTKGLDIITLTDDNYMSFGKDGDIKWVQVSYVDGRGSRRGSSIPVTFSKVNTEVKSVIGKENLAFLKENLKPLIEGSVLKRKKFEEFASTLISE